MNFVDDPESAVLAAAKDMLRRGLVEGTAGNISARRSDGNVVITPSSVDYAEMLLHDLVLVDAGGAVLHAKDGRSPSTELNLHLACYRAFDDIGSVIHSHPVWATMFAVAHEPIPACIDEFAIYCGGDVRCTEYAASGTPEVGRNAVRALEGAPAIGVRSCYGCDRSQVRNPGRTVRSRPLSGVVSVWQTSCRPPMCISTRGYTWPSMLRM